VLAAAGPESTGWLVPPGDAEALADRLMETLELAAPTRVRIGEYARRHAVASFSIESMQLSTLGVYDRVLGTTLKAQFSSGPTLQRSTAL
jgi:glycosyltransferase involved in cell wall biosynthesis